MELVLFIVVFVLFSGLLIFGSVKLLTRTKKRKLSKKINKISNEDKLIAIDDMRSYLRTNPNDYETRNKLINFLFEKQMYLPAIKECLIMISASASHSELSELEYTVKIGEAYYYLKNFQDAKKYLSIAQKIDDTNFKVNLFLGKMEYDNQNYDRALAKFNKAEKIEAGNLEVAKAKGICNYQIKHYRDAINSLSKVIKGEAGDVETYFYMGMSYYNAGQNEFAKKYLTKVIDNPVYKLRVYFVLGNIFKKEDLYMKAVEYLEEVILAGTIDNTTKSEALYQVADCYVKTHNVAKALTNLEEIARINPDYKDIQKKIEMYSQLNTNTLLEKYLIGSVSQFTNICKLFVKYYVSKFSPIKGKIKFLDAEVNFKGEMEINIEIASNKFITLYFFIFFRSTSSIGELEVRNIYNMLREKKIDKGICVTAGSFSETAKNFSESRMLEVVEKKQLVDILNKIGEALNKQPPKKK